jgi:hypothetical protein
MAESVATRRATLAELLRPEPLLITAGAAAGLVIFALR